MIRKILVTGSRDWYAREEIHRELAYLAAHYGARHLLVIHGGAAGVDSAANEAAQSLGIHTARVDALWSHYHRAAGPTRNAVMLALAPDEALAFSRNIATSKGTANMVGQLEKAGIPVRVVDR